MARFLPLLLFTAILLVGCSSGKGGNAYQQITQQQAKEMMDENSDLVVLDVREEFEYDSGHIPNAVLLPLGEIDEDTASQAIPTKESVVLVYCRSGNRSKSAASLLADLGYTEVYEFGGIATWPYEIE